LPYHERPPFKTENTLAFIEMAKNDRIRLTTKANYEKRRIGCTDLNAAAVSPPLAQDSARALAHSGKLRQSSNFIA
jgi:hypothetical protein